MESKSKLEQSGIQLPPPFGSKSSNKSGGGPRRGPRWKFELFNSNLGLFLLLMLTIFVKVEGNEIESCLKLIHSQNSVGASASSQSYTSSLISGNSVKNGGGSRLSPGNNNLVPPTNPEHSYILCQLRTLHPDLDISNLTSSIPSNQGVVDITTITKLKLVCNDVLFFESNVSPGQLSSLSELHDLIIDKCKLKHLPADFLQGLRHLRKLTINTGNSDWAARSLEISPGALSPVMQLRHLHLGYNHMWNLPERLLCQVGNLQSLNLTHNLLSDVDDLGIPGGQGQSGRTLPLQEYRSSTQSSVNSAGESCLGELKTFDLSYNSLRTLGSRRLERIRRLQEFRIDHNWLEEIEDDAFIGLGQLRLLNLSSNRLVALPSKLFQPSKLLQELDLRNNSLTALAPGLLSGLEHLQILDLSMNSLSSQWITNEAFKSLVRLVILNLSYNQLTHLAPSSFNDLYSLQVLDLGNNLINSIEDGTFARMTNLHSLNLGRNRLVNINSNMFNGLYVLHKLILDYNKVEKIEQGALRNCTSLQDLGLVGNQLKQVPEALRGLQLLRTLDLGENRISTLNNESFQGMGQLYGLRLVDNQLEEVPKGLCDSVPRLRVFNIAQNKIKKISSSAFTSCNELKVLRLDSNQLDILPLDLAPQLPNLLWLNVSENRIRRADYSLLPTTLEWFDVSYNKLEQIGGAWTKTSTSGSPADPTDSIQRVPNSQNARLRVVDASHNLLQQLDHNAVPSNLEILRLSHNRLKRIAPDTFSRSSNLRRVELIGNQLENIPLNALRLPPIPAGRLLPEFFLGGNPFLCDCEMEWLTRINQLSALRQHPTVLDLDAIVCRLSYSRTVTHVPLPDIKPQDFLCPYKSHCFALCHCCEFDACDCQMNCPQNCTCYHDDTWSANVVNCASTQHTAIPSRLPMDSTEVYLDGNNIPVLKSHAFIGRKNIRILFLNSSGIDTISNKSFNGLQSLQSLHLENNSLKNLHGYEFDHLTRLRELYLQDNRIESITNTTFLQLKSLEILRIDGNRLVTFTVWQLSLNPYLVEIGLARNEWNCDCQFLHQLYGWVTDNSRKVVDLGQLQCVWNTTHKPGPHLIDYNRTCGSSWALMGLDGQLDFSSFSPLPLIICLVSLLLLVVICIIVLVMCRNNARLFLFSHFGIRMCSTDQDNEKVYDAYLIYSQKDEEFVAQRIADELETNDSYRLCLHYRDLISETGDLKEMMIGAVENSKSVVIILSRNFLQGEWTSGEYRSGFNSVLKKSQKNYSKEVKKVVIVFIDDIPAMDVNPDIRSWVRHNRIQVIKWSISDQRKERKFWQKLKYSLPPPSSHYNSNITSNTTTATSASSGETSSVNGVMATLKYQGMEGQQVIVDEYNRAMIGGGTMKLWPNFVALPPKYQSPGSPGGQSHLSLSQYNHSQVSQASPHHQNYHQQINPNPYGSNTNTNSSHHHYHPPLPLSNPPKSPPSSKSTDSTTTNGDEVQGINTPTSFSLMFQQMQIQQQQAKSPLPVPKVYNSTNSNVLNNSNSANGGESYLSLEGEHVYSTLDPPSPQTLQQHQQQLVQNPNRLLNSLNTLNNVHLPNGYTYQPQPTVGMGAHPQVQSHQNQHQNQWHPQPHTPKGTLTFGSAKGYKKENSVQTYLV